MIENVITFIGWFQKMLAGISHTTLANLSGQGPHASFNLRKFKALALVLQSGLSKQFFKVHSMNPPPLKILLTHLEWNIQRLDESLKNDKTDYYRDAALQRFGHTFDMAVKCIDALADSEGKQLESSRQGFLWAAENQWIATTTPLETMLEDHAALSQKQEDASPEAVFVKLNNYLHIFKELHSNLTAFASPS